MSSNLRLITDRPTSLASTTPIRSAPDDVDFAFSRRPDKTGALTFTQAFAVWIETITLRNEGSATTEVRYITPKTEKEYRQLAKALGKTFGSMQIAEINVGHLREYQRARAFADGEWARPAGANLIRKEITMLIRILRAAGYWNELKMKKLFRPVNQAHTDVQRAMTPDEQERFLATAASKERWHYIRNYTVAALQTTCSTNEMRRLRMGDIQLDNRVVLIRREGAKNRHRMRSIPIETDECRWAFEALMYRAQSLGAASPQHYLFPIMNSHHSYDPTTPMGDTGLRGRFNEVREAAGLPWLRPYDLRHTGISRLAEAGVPMAVILSFAGHVTYKMQQHYTTISVMSQRKAVGAAWKTTAPPYMMGITPHNNGFNLYRQA